MKRIRFTLVELLVVIAIIAILAGLLLGAVSMALAKAKKTAAKADALELKSALLKFQNDYQRLPTLDDAVVDNRVLSMAQYKDLINVLRGRPNLAKDNKRGRPYLPLERPFEGADQYKCKLVNSYKTDPNGAPFYVIFDTAEDGISFGGITINEPAVVFWEETLNPATIGGTTISAAQRAAIKDNGVCSAELP